MIRNFDNDVRIDPNADGLGRLVKIDNSLENIVKDMRDRYQSYLDSIKDIREKMNEENYLVTKDYGIAIGMSDNKLRSCINYIKIDFEEKSTQIQRLIADYFAKAETIDIEDKKRNELYKVIARLRKEQEKIKNDAEYYRSMYEEILKTSPSDRKKLINKKINENENLSDIRILKAKVEMKEYMKKAIKSLVSSINYNCEKYNNKEYTYSLISRFSKIENVLGDIDEPELVKLYNDSIYELLREYPDNRDLTPYPELAEAYVNYSERDFMLENAINTGDFDYVSKVIRGIGTISDPAIREERYIQVCRIIKNAVYELLDKAKDTKNSVLLEDAENLLKFLPKESPYNNSTNKYLSGEVRKNAEEILNISRKIITNNNFDKKIK